MGVDYSSSMVNIRDFHAYDIKNFIKKNNVLRNRNGYEQVGKYKINGLWQCTYNKTNESDYNSVLTIAHINQSLFFVEDIDKYDVLANNYRAIDSSVNKLANNDSWGVFANDRLYILDGEKYCVLKFPTEENNYEWSFSEVFDDVDTYVPTTTIGITFSGNKATINRTNLDNMNILSSYRYNTISTIVGEGEEAYYNNYETKHHRTYILDSDNILNISLFKIKFVDAIGVVKELTAEIQSSQGLLTLNVPAVDLGLVDQVGLVTIGEVYGNGTLILYYDFKQPNELEDNVTIKFKTGYKTEEDLINKCRFGVVYGANGNRNRLFLTGNPDKPNVDYYTSRRNIYATDSDVDLQDSQDFTYFSVYDYCAYGTSNTKITDYQIMGNGDLMVLKENNLNEPNIYFRNGQFTVNEDGYTIESYPMRSGNISYGSKTQGTLKNLNNDLVFVSIDGVYGISSTVTANVLNSDYQYAYPRSNLINSKLSELISDSSAITATIYDNRYILTLKGKNDEYKTFLADGRYPYKLPESVDNEYEYEWFVLDNIKADKYYIINNILYFTNKNGLYKFDFNAKQKEHYDIDRQSVLSGDMEYHNGEVIANQFILEFIKPQSKFILSSDANAYVIKHAKTDIDGNLEVFSDDCRAYMEDSKSYDVYIQRKGQTTQQRVYLIEQQDEYNVYDVYSDKTYENKYELEIDCEYDLLFKANGKVFTFSMANGEIESLIDIYGYNVDFTDIDLNTTVPLSGVIENKTVVDCLYVTKAFNMGQSLYNKNLKSITVVNDAESYSWVNFAIRTKKVKKRFTENIVGGTEGIADTYENIFKADLTDGTFATSFTKNYYLKFNFVQFEFFNNNGSDCIINNINVVYTTGFKQGGIS